MTHRCQFVHCSARVPGVTCCALPRIAAAAVVALAGIGASDGAGMTLCSDEFCWTQSADGGWGDAYRNPHPPIISTPIYGAPMTGRTAPDAAATETVDQLRARVTALEARLADVERRVAAAEKRCRR